MDPQRKSLLRFCNIVTCLTAPCHSANDNDTVLALLCDGTGRPSYRLKWQPHNYSTTTVSFSFASPYLQNQFRYSFLWLVMIQFVSIITPISHPPVHWHLYYQHCHHPSLSGFPLQAETHVNVFHKSFTSQIVDTTSILLTLRTFWPFFGFLFLIVFFVSVFSELTWTPHHVYVRHMSSSVRLSSVTLVHPTQAIEIFGNIFMPCGTLTIRDLCIKNFTEIVPGKPLRRGS